MIERLDSGDEPILVFRMSGKLRDRDYRSFVLALVTGIKRHGMVRVLAHFHNFHGWDLHALWDDIRFATAHWRHIERVAFVGENRWEVWMAKVGSAFAAARIQYYGDSEIRGAWNWLSEGCRV